MLTDNEIYAAVKTLKQQFGGNIKGLYDPQSMNAKRLRKAQVYVQYSERFVQILHDGSLHWFTLSNIRSTKAHQIQSYDSLFVDSTYVHNKMLQIRQKLFSLGRYIYVICLPFLQHTNIKISQVELNDCNFFSLKSFCKINLTVIICVIGVGLK